MSNIWPSVARSLHMQYYQQLILLYYHHQKIFREEFFFLARKKIRSLNTFLNLCESFSIFSERSELKFQILCCIAWWNLIVIKSNFLMVIIKNWTKIVGSSKQLWHMQTNKLGQGRSQKVLIRPRKIAIFLFTLASSGLWWEAS